MGKSWRSCALAVAFCAAAARVFCAATALCADIGKLQESLRSSDAKVRQKAAFVLGTLGSDAAAARADLQAALNDSDTKVRSLSAWALEQLSEAANEGERPTDAALTPPPPEDLPSLIELLQHPDPYERASVAQTIGQRAEAGEPAVPALIVALDDVAALVRWRAAEALGQIGPPAKTAVPALLRRLSRDSSPRARNGAALAICRIIPEAADLADDLVARDPTAMQRLHEVAGASVALSDFADPVAVSTYIEMLHNDSKSVRFRAASSLRSLDLTAAAALPALRRALLDPDQMVRREAARAYDQIWQAVWQFRTGRASLRGRISRSVLVYAELLQDGDEQTRLLAADSLSGRWLLGNIVPAIPQLGQALRDESAGVRLLAVEALANLKARARAQVPDLSRLLHDENASVRAAAFRALALIDPDGTDAREQTGVNDEGGRRKEE